MKILVRSPNWIGDAVLCLSSIAYLKEKMPQAHITMLAKDWVKDVFLNHPAIDEIISLNKVSITLIKKSKFDIGILFTNSFSSAFLFFLADVKKRIGYKTDLRSLFLTDGIPLPKNLNTLHQKDYYFELVRNLVHGNDAVKNPVLYISDEENEKADRMLESLGIHKTIKNENPQSPKSPHIPSFRSHRTAIRNPIVGIFPGASYGPAKMWDTRNFKLLTDKIIKTDIAKVLIFGGKKEKELGEIIQNEGSNIINLCGKTTLRETMALIKRCAVFITNDTGPMHIASALNIPVIAIFGPTNAERTSPLGHSVIMKKEVSCSPCKYRICPLKNHECMNKISVEEVFETVKKYT